MSSEIIADGRTRIGWAPASGAQPVDLTGFVRDLGIELDPWQEQVLSASMSWPTGFRWTSRGYAAPGQYEAIAAVFEHCQRTKRRRVHRIHSAYRRRRGWGRW